ncbi:hypothetical protein ElyMa_004180400 [Elysia marginata]|uniref:Uncharacterized protein n=1 Tax=Elysia marginata TaxID=1093978 RepID=A0AAV4GM10_9GAST|nr:hypothetical protein ElyMa_004180400 [Elysia marginata]
MDTATLPCTTKQTHTIIFADQNRFLFRLRANHNRLNFRLYTKLGIGHTGQWPCQTGNMTGEHYTAGLSNLKPTNKSYWAEEHQVTPDQKLREV